MSIQVKCQCGKRLQMKDTLAGKSVRCPGCEELLRIPRPAKSASSDEDPGSVADLLDEIGFVASVKNSCPECKQQLPAAAVLCIQCGYHLEKRRRLHPRRL